MESWHSGAEKIATRIGRVFAGKGKVMYRIGRIADFPFRVWVKFEKLGFKRGMKFVWGKIVGEKPQKESKKSG